jgi:nanoRNase/pAp phosphatase (c-di-AMP/oligoRNAs hydrolase)
MEKNEFDLDCVAMFAFENNQISLRSIKDNSSARIVAEKYGGGGHDKAAAIPITDEMRSKIIGSVFNN